MSSSLNLERRPLQQKDLQPGTNRSSSSTRNNYRHAASSFLDISAERAWTLIQHTCNNRRHLWLWVPQKMSLPKERELEPSDRSSTTAGPSVWAKQDLPPASTQRKKKNNSKDLHLWIAWWWSWTAGPLPPHKILSVSTVTASKPA